MIFDIFNRFKERLVKTRQVLGSVFSNKTVSNEDWQRWEADLYRTDFGIEVTEILLSRMKTIAKADKTCTGGAVLRQVLMETLQGAEGAMFSFENRLQVFMLLGINGVGKTTTAVKLAHYWQNKGVKILLGSCDTFRSAADHQLKTWADRLQLNCIGSQQGADAAAVGYDVCQAGMYRGYKAVILDTAGRLHNKVFLLEELKKMIRVLQKCDVNFPQHRWLVIDGSLGTNSIEQAKLFHEAIGLTGLVITKLDGTSKGGALVGIFNKLRVPIYFVGLGEEPDDLRPFSVKAYIDALINS